MKKRISLLGLALILVLGFTGCSKSEETEYDTAQLGQYADFIVDNFSKMQDADFQNFEEMSDLQLDLTMLQTGVPVTGENFVTMIEAWKAGEDECGEYVSHGDYEATTSNGTLTLTAPAEFENRTGTIAIAFDEDMNMESLTVAADYSTGEILEKAGLNTILGMGTVFVVLIFISFIISLFKFIPELQKKFGRKEKPALAEEPKAASTAPAAEAESTEDTELAAVIAAAIAASEGTSTDGFIVRSIKRRKSNKWN